MIAMSCAHGDPFRGNVFPDGKEDLLAAIHRAGGCDGPDAAIFVVEPCSHLASHGALLVGGLSQWMV